MDPLIEMKVEDLLQDRSPEVEAPVWSGRRRPRHLAVELCAVRTADQTQILDELSEGDVVATKGGYGLPDDCPVVVVPASQ